MNIGGLACSLCGKYHESTACNAVIGLAPAPPEPSGLWACWSVLSPDTGVPSLGRREWPGHDTVQLPASMTAREIARLTVGDCRRMEGE
jgi:hypothetical protein